MRITRELPIRLSKTEVNRSTLSSIPSPRNSDPRGFSLGSPRGPQFIPFLAVAISAGAFAKLGAMSVQVAVLSGALWATVAIILAMVGCIMWRNHRMSDSACSFTT